MRVAIGIPSGDTVHADFACALASLCAYSNKADIALAIINHKGPLIAENRNRIVAEAQKLEAEYVLFIDADMTFPPTTLLHLIVARKAIVACDARRKRGEHSTIAVKDGLPLGKTDELVSVDSIGTGIMLIHMSVFKDMPKPWFSEHYDEVKDRHVGGDIHFCWRAKLLNFPIYCHGKLSQQIGHLGLEEYRI